MEFIGRYCLTLTLLFLALTGHAQNQRVTSLTAGAGGLTNLTGRLEQGGMFNLIRISGPGPTAPATVVAGAAGNLNGEMTYKVTFVTPFGETDASGETVSEIFSNQRADLSGIVVSPSPLVTARRIYRKDSSTMLTWELVTQLNDNTTTVYTDNISEADLGIQIPNDNEAGGGIYVMGVVVFHVSTNNIAGNAYVGWNVAPANIGIYNAFVGHNIMTNAATNVATTASTALGNEALRDLILSDAITALGHGALRVARSNANYNSATGVDALGGLIAGPGNSAFGRDAGFGLAYGTNNAFFAHFAGEDLRIGSNNLVLAQHGTFEWNTNYNSIAIGAFAHIWTNNFMHFGGAPLFARISNYVFGPYLHATPSPVILNAPSGLGANIAGGNFSIAAGASTGNGAEGVIPFLTSGAGASGSGLNAWVERAQVNSNGLAVAGFITLNEVAAPNTPASGKVALYTKADGKAYIKDDAGTETDLTATAAGGSGIATNDGTGWRTTFQGPITNNFPGEVTPASVFKHWFGNALTTNINSMGWLNADNGDGTSNEVCYLFYSNVTPGAGVADVNKPGWALVAEGSFLSGGDKKIEIYWTLTSSNNVVTVRPLGMVFGRNGTMEFALNGPWTVNNGAATTNYVNWGTEAGNAGSHSIYGILALNGGRAANLGLGGSSHLHLKDRGIIEIANTDESGSFYARVDTDEKSLNFGGVQAANTNINWKPWSGSGAVNHLIPNGSLQLGINPAIVTNMLTATASLDFGSIGGSTNADLAITVTGTTTNDVAQLGVPWQVGNTPSLDFSCFTSNDTVWVRCTNNRTNAAVDPAAAVFRAIVTKVR